MQAERQFTYTTCPVHIPRCKDWSERLAMRRLKLGTVSYLDLLFQQTLRAMPAGGTPAGAPAAVKD
eukprot:15322764-Alexandrium_andersonii.AAC.1